MMLLVMGAGSERQWLMQWLMYRVLCTIKLNNDDEVTRVSNMEDPMQEIELARRT